MKGIGTSTEERPAAALTGVDTRVGLATTPSPDRRRQSFGWLVIGMGVLTACATMPPERAARRALLEKAATDCQRRFPVVTKVEVDPFDQIVAWLWEDTPQTALDPFWQCVRDRVQELERASPAASPGASTVRNSPVARRELDEAGSADEAKVAAPADRRAPLAQRLGAGPSGTTVTGNIALRTIAAARAAEASATDR
ncbi:MAG: hypothetical protein ACHQCI_10725 [Solirubrobacterales bacterium]